MNNTVTLKRSDFENVISELDSQIVSLQYKKDQLGWIIQNWDKIAMFSESTEVVEQKKVEEVAEEVVQEVAYACPYCAYTCKKERGMKQHITHVHTPETFTLGPIEPPVVCLEDGCGKEFKNNAGLMVHISAAHREKTSLPPKSPKSSEPHMFEKFRPVEKPLRSVIVTCPNPSCNRLLRFVKGTGYVVGDKEFCNKRCFMEWEDAGKS